MSLDWVSGANRGVVEVLADLDELVRQGERSLGHVEVSGDAGSDEACLEEVDEELVEEEADSW